MQHHQTWFQTKCQELGGKMFDPEICYISRSAYPYDYFIAPPPHLIIKMDQSIARYRIWWWIGFLIALIIVPLVFYQIYGWNVINFNFGIILVFMVLVYGHRISRTWRILFVIVIIYEIWYVGLLFYTLWISGTWYPPDFDLWGHIIMGFFLYFAFSSVMPRRHPVVILALSTLTGILYECLEWFCSTFYELPLLWWTLDNAIFDTRNNIIGSIIAMVLEYMIRRSRHKKMLAQYNKNN